MNDGMVLWLDLAYPVDDMADAYPTMDEDLDEWAQRGDDAPGPTPTSSSAQRAGSRAIRHA